MSCGVVFCKHFRFYYVARFSIKYRMGVSMRLSVPFDQADLTCLSSFDIVSWLDG